MGLFARRRDPKNPNLTVCIGVDYVAEIYECAVRLDRPLSWIARRAWELARAEIMRMPAPPKL